MIAHAYETYPDRLLYPDTHIVEIVKKGYAVVDKVNHPKHYNSHPSGVECISIAEHMSYNIGNAIKYLWRSDLKDNPMEDLEKAIWYIKREITRREQE